MKLRIDITKLPTLIVKLLIVSGKLSVGKFGW